MAPGSGCGRSTVDPLRDPSPGSKMDIGNYVSPAFIDRVRDSMALRTCLHPVIPAPVLERLLTRQGDKETRGIQQIPGRLLLPKDI